MVPFENPTCDLIDRFTLKEKVVMRSGVLGLVAVGAGSIYLQNPLVAGLYLVGSLVSAIVVLLPGLCAHCPYPSHFSTCLFLPAGLLNRWYPYRGPQMSVAGKLAVAAVTIGIVATPQYWLIANRALLIVFWLLALPVLAAFPLHYCRRCRHSGCPLNRATADA